MIRRATLIVAVILLSILSQAFAQSGGNGVYSFLNIPASARIAAMGGTLISIKDDDLNCALQNPSALNPSMNNYLSFSGLSFFDGIKFGDAAYARDFKKYGTFGVWMHYANYGNFKQTDITGEITGNFTTADYALSFGWGYQLNKLFSVGANLKGIYSDYYLVNSFGIASDISFMYQDSMALGFLNGLTASIVARNLGSQLKPYTEGINEPLPAEVMLSISKRFVHSPFRFTFLYRHLEKYDMTFVDTNDPANYDAVTGSFDPEEPSFWKKGLEHLTPAIEIILSKNFYLVVAYSFQRKDELSIDTRKGTVGLSFGGGIKISKFIISYGHANYHLAGGSNHFSIAANLSEFSRKK